jgi:hypothetical protein
MFDSYHISTRPQHVSVDITEKRAPTDESVRLLRDMERAAEKRVTEAIRLDGNVFKGALHRQDDGLSDRTLWRAIFDLNSKRIDVRIDQARDEHMADFAPRMAREIGEVIASHILGDLSQGLERSKFR